MGGLRNSTELKKSPSGSLVLGFPYCGWGQARCRKGGTRIWMAGNGPRPKKDLRCGRLVWKNTFGTVGSHGVGGVRRVGVLKNLKLV